ncbi:unnamed protein product [Gadus morhua 'NCC']
MMTSGVFIRGVVVCETKTLPKPHWKQLDLASGYPPEKGGQQLLFTCQPVPHPLGPQSGLRQLSWLITAATRPMESQDQNSEEPEQSSEEPGQNSEEPEQSLEDPEQSSEEPEEHSEEPEQNSEDPEH